MYVYLRIRDNAIIMGRRGGGPRIFFEKYINLLLTANSVQFKFV